MRHLTWSFAPQHGSVFSLQPVCTNEANECPPEKFYFFTSTLFRPARRETSCFNNSSEYGKELLNNSTCFSSLITKRLEQTESTDNLAFVSNCACNVGVARFEGQWCEGDLDASIRRNVNNILLQRTLIIFERTVHLAPGVPGENLSLRLFQPAGIANL